MSNELSTLLTDAASMIENLRNGDDAYYTPEKMDAMQASLRAAALSRPQDGADRQDAYKFRRLAQLLSGFDFRLGRNALMPPATYLDSVEITCEFQPGIGQSVIDAIVDLLVDATPTAGQGGDYSACCDTPAYCSSVRRCTAKDSATPAPAAPVSERARDELNPPLPRDYHSDGLDRTSAGEPNPHPAATGLKGIRTMIDFTTSQRFLAQWGVGTDLFIGAIRDGDQCIALIARDGLTDEQAMQNARALEQALTQQRGECAASASLKEIVPAEKRNYLDDNGNPRSIEDEAYAHGWNACRSATIKKLEHTTPQPSAEGLRELVRDWNQRADRSDAEDKAEDAYAACADELESLLAGGGGK